MWTENGGASAIAQAAASAEDVSLAGDAANPALAARFGAVLALKKAMGAHEALTEALRVIVEEGTDVDLEGVFYPDDVAVLDLVNEIGIAHAGIMRWLAALQGKQSLARLMLEGPPGFVPERLRGMDASTWWTTADPDELRSADGDFFDRDLVARETRGLFPAPDPKLMRRVMVAPDGHCWELNAPAVFDTGVRDAYEAEHGELIELELFPVDADDANTMWKVEEQVSDGVRMLVGPALLTDYAALYAAVLQQRRGLGDPANMLLVDPLSGNRFTLKPDGTLLNENAAPCDWPVSLNLWRLFPPGSPEPGREVQAVWTLGADGTTRVNAVRFDRLEQEDRDVWARHSTGEDTAAQTWRSVNMVELVAHDPLRRSHDV